MHYVF